MAERESRKTTERLRRKLADRARNGQPHGSRRCFGYKVGNMEIDEVEASILREMGGKLLVGCSQIQLEIRRAVRRLPGHLQDRRDRRERGGHPPGQDQLPARPGRRDRHRRGFSPLTRQTSPSPRSWPRSSCPASSPATARTGPVPGNQEGRDFPARKPGEPSVVCVTRGIEFHLLRFIENSIRRNIGRWPHGRNQETC